MNKRRDIVFHAIGAHRVRVVLARSVAATAHRLGAPGMEDARAVYIAAGDTRGENTPHGWIVFDREPDAATIAHEASHAIRAMFKYMGIRNDDEAFAYALEFLVGAIHSFIEGTK